MDAATTSEPKNFAWSYSRLHSFEDCPRRYKEVQVDKNWPEPKSEILEWGDAVHEAMAKTLKTGEPLPTQFRLFQSWIDKVVRTKGELLIEDDCRWAITREFKPTPWFAKNVWLRCIADAVVLDPPAALVVDWKAGKSLNVDPIQLTLTSLVALLQFPEIQGVRSDFIWLQEDTQTTQMLYRHEAADAWAEILPRVKRFENAVINDNFPPQPGRFCAKWCSVRSCEYNGR